MAVSVKSQWFHQNRMNVAKMGAYYTDISHCRDIGKMFRFSTEEQTCVLEPSIGDGSAVKAVTGVESNSNIRIFGVELHDTVAETTAADPNMEAILQGDFLSDVMITNGAFSFCFANPPYMDVEEEEELRSVGHKTERIERRFLEKVSGYLKTGGICVWVIPHRVLYESSYLSYWMSRFETLAIYKFREDEYAKYKQIVAIGKRRSGAVGVMKEDREKMQEMIALEKLEVLPSSFEESKIIDVPTSSVANIKNFRARQFDGSAALLQVDHSEQEKLAELFFASRTFLEVPEGNGTKILTPPVPLKKANRALLVSCGIGSGLAGTDGVDLHLQRGCVEEIEMHEVSDGYPQVETVKTMSKVNLIIIENDGTIRELV